MKWRCDAHCADGVDRGGTTLSTQGASFVVVMEERRELLLPRRMRKGLRATACWGPFLLLVSPSSCATTRLEA